MANPPQYTLSDFGFKASFTADGDLLRWHKPETPQCSFVLNRPVYANARTEWQGIQLWVKSRYHTTEERQLLPQLETTISNEIEAVSSAHLKIGRFGNGWHTIIEWRMRKNGLSLSAEVVSEDTARQFQIELLYWLPFCTPRRGTITGMTNSESEDYLIPRYGRAKEKFFDRGSPLVYRNADFQLHVAAQQTYGLSHFYHRGLAVKLGSASDYATGEKHGKLDVNFTITQNASPTAESATRKEVVIRRTKPAPMPSLKERGYPVGLMLNLQYTQESNVENRLRRWIQLAGYLKFDFILLELDRALRIHPYCTPEALELSAFATLAQETRSEGLSLIPCYNLLGHQFETGLLQWKPEWRETELDGLCVSHPEVQSFVQELIHALLESFCASWIHIGGDELRLPHQVRSLHCDRCGYSPNLTAIVDYWNSLQSTLPKSKHIAIWGDQLLPAQAVAKGLSANNWDANAEEHLRHLNKKIQIINWQYSTIDPTSSQDFLKHFGHTVGLASGQYHLENPFMNAALCRSKKADSSLHTTWASLHPADCPLESIAAAVLAHSHIKYDPQKTADICTRHAEWMFEYLSDI